MLRTDCNNTITPKFWRLGKVINFFQFLTNSKKFLSYYKYQYIADFDEFSTVWKPFSSAFDWCKNHQNPVYIDTHNILVVKTFYCWLKIKENQSLFWAFMSLSSLSRTLSGSNDTLFRSIRRKTWQIQDRMPDEGQLWTTII